MSSELFIGFIVICIFLIMHYANNDSLRFFNQISSDNILNDILVENGFIKENTANLREKMGIQDENNVDLLMAKTKSLNDFNHDDNFIKPTVLTLSDENRITQKYQLWNLFSKKLDEKDLLNILPETFNLLNAKDFKKLNEQSYYINNPEYILKSESSTYVSNNDMGDLLKHINDTNRFHIRQFTERLCSYQKLNSLRYTVAQKYVKKQALINGFNFKVKCYLLITKYGGSTKGYLYKNGHIYYAKEKANPLHISRFNAIASREMMYMNRTPEQVRSIYQGMPRSILQWKKFLKSNTVPLDNLVNLSKVVCDICDSEVGNSLVSVNNESFGLYELDVLFKDDYKPLLLKLVPVKQIENPTAIEQKIRKNVWNSTLSETNLIQNNDSGMKLIYDSK